MTIGTGRTIGRTTTTRGVVGPGVTRAGTIVKISFVGVTTLEEIHTTTTIDDAEDRTTIDGTTIDGTTIDGTTIDGMNIRSTIDAAAAVVTGLEGGTTTETEAENLTDAAAAVAEEDGSEPTEIGRRRETITTMGLREVDGRRGIDTMVGWGERGRGRATEEVKNASATIEEEREEEEELNRGLVIVNQSDNLLMVTMVDDGRGLSRHRGLGRRNNGRWRRESSWRVNGWNKTRRATQRQPDAMGITKNVNGKFTLGIYNLVRLVRHRCAIC